MNREIIVFTELNKEIKQIVDLMLKVINEAEKNIILSDDDVKDFILEKGRSQIRCSSLEERFRNL